MKRSRQPSATIYRSPLRRRVRSDEYLLWTVMHPDRLDALLENGAVSGRSDLIWDGFELGYQWMMDQMERSIPGYNREFPIWAWYSPKPDLRQSMYRDWDRPAVLIEWCAPKETVLLSDLDLWNAALSGHCITFGEAEEAAWKQRVQRQTGNEYVEYVDLPAELQLEMAQSWQCIFDLDQPLDPDWHGSNRCIQAVVPIMRLEQIVSIRELSWGYGSMDRYRATIYTPEFG